MFQGSFRPEDIVIMRDVLHDWCTLHERDPQSPQGIAAALKLLELMRDRPLTYQQLLRGLEESGAFPN